MVASRKIGTAVGSGLFAVLLVVVQPARVCAQGNGNGNGVANRVAALESEVASLTSTVNALQASVGALESAGTETALCFDLIATYGDPLVTFPSFVGRVKLSAVPQGSQGLYKLVGVAKDWEYGGTSFPTSPSVTHVFDPLYGSAFVTSNGAFHFAFFVGTTAAKFQEIRADWSPQAQTGQFFLRSTDEDNNDAGRTLDYSGPIAAVSCGLLALP